MPIIFSTPIWARLSELVWYLYEYVVILQKILLYSTKFSRLYYKKSHFCPENMFENWYFFLEFEFFPRFLFNFLTFGALELFRECTKKACSRLLDCARMSIRQSLIPMIKGTKFPWPSKNRRKLWDGELFMRGIPTPCIIIHDDSIYPSWFHSQAHSENSNAISHEGSR